MPEFTEITAFMIAQLTGFLQLRDRSNDRAQSVFVTHPTTMFAAVSSCMLYYLLHIAMPFFPTSRYAVAAQSFLVLSAYAAVSTLAAATLPDWVSPPIYTVFGLLSAGELLNMFRDRVVVIEGEEEEGEASTSENIYTRRFHRFFKKTCSVVVEFFQQQPQPIPLATIAVDLQGVMVMDEGEDRLSGESPEIKFEKEEDFKIESLVLSEMGKGFKHVGEKKSG